MPAAPLDNAAAAWAALTGEHVRQGARRGQAAASSTAVVCFESRGRAVVAKQCSAATAELEYEIYRDLLPRIGRPTLACYGFAPAADGDHVWLFVEDAGGIAYDPRDPDHRAAAASWLGALHASLRPPAPTALPGKQADNYRALLDRVLNALAAVAPRLPSVAGQRALVASVVEHCQRLADDWAPIAAACTEDLASLVHGDLVTHNARLRRLGDTLVLLPFDWEKAGWGPPAEDVSDVDLVAYLRAAADLGLHRDRQILERMAGAGKAFRCLVFLEWLLPQLRRHSAEALAHLEQCRSWLDHINRHRPWSSA